MIPHLNLLFLASLLLVTSCDNPTETRIVNDNPIQWLLPSSLHEASGLAVAGQESVYLHNDEEGEIYLFNIRSGSIMKLASISWPPIKEDFEGIAVITGSIYMMTSDGELFEIDDVSTDKPHQVVGARKITTDLEENCEFEGLHHLDNLLLMPCKEDLNQASSDRFRVFAFDTSTESTSEFLSLNTRGIEGIKKIAPTAFEATARYYYIISEDRLVRLDRITLQGDSFQLSTDLHSQVEGIAIFPDGTIILVEDNRRGLARLTRYNGLEELIKLNP